MCDVYVLTGSDIVTMSDDRFACGTGGRCTCKLPTDKQCCECYGCSRCCGCSSPHLVERVTKVSTVAPVTHTTATAKASAPRHNLITFGKTPVNYGAAPTSQTTVSVPSATAVADAIDLVNTTKMDASNKDPAAVRYNLSNYLDRFRILCAHNKWNADAVIQYYKIHSVDGFAYKGLTSDSQDVRKAASSLK